MASARPRPPRATARRVFISSTQVDLARHREAVHDTLLRLNLFPVGTEHFGAQSADPTTASLDQVRSSDLYIGLVAWRYGSIPAGETHSVTHLEYAEATRLRLPCLIFLADPATEALDGPDDLFPAVWRNPAYHVQLLAFRAELEGAHVVDYFTTPEDLAGKVATALVPYIAARSPRLSRRQVTLAGLAGLGALIAAGIAVLWQSIRSIFAALWEHLFPVVQPAGIWVSPTAGQTVVGVVHFAARAFPTKSSDPPISYVNFTAFFPEARGWQIACQVLPPPSGDVFACDRDLAQLGAPAGALTISFDVYDVAQHVHKAPNGERTIEYVPSS